MSSAQPVSATIRARIIHGALVFSVVLYWVVAWAMRERSLPADQLPDRRVLYVGLAVASAVLFGAAAFSTGRLVPPRGGASEDEWWSANLGRAVVIWALVETPVLLGLIVYVLTRDFRTLLAPFIGLLLFANYNPRRLSER